MSARGDKFMMAGKIGGFLSRHNRFASGTALVLAVAAIFAFIYSPRVVGAAVTERELPVYSVERDGKFVSLSFDAAWGNEDTQMLIDILAKYNVKATFFVVGEWVDKYPESVKALHDAGHEVMNHSDAHPHMAKLTAKQIIDEVNRCSDKIEAVTGVRPTLFRCPYGEYDDNVIGTVNGMGLTAVQWDTDSLDWKKLTAGEIYKRVSSKVQPGSIVLFHNAGLRAKNVSIAQCFSDDSFREEPYWMEIYAMRIITARTGALVPGGKEMTCIFAVERNYQYPCFVIVPGSVDRLSRWNSFHVYAVPIAVSPYINTLGEEKECLVLLAGDIYTGM